MDSLLSWLYDPSTPYEVTPEIELHWVNGRFLLRTPSSTLLLSPAEASLQGLSALVTRLTSPAVVTLPVQQVAIPVVLT